MAQIMCEITLDLSANESGLVIEAKQGDSNSRLLCVRLADRGRPVRIEAGSTVLLNATHGEGADAFAGYVSNGAAIFVLPEAILAEAKDVKCDVSVLGGDASRLTTAAFTVRVGQAVCPDGGTATPMGTDLVAEWLATGEVQPLYPTAGDTGYLLNIPRLNRKYAVDLSDDKYKDDGVWREIGLVLPTPDALESESWVMLYCHAPKTALGGAVRMNWGKSGEVLFADGQRPLVTMEDFDVFCTYSPVAGKWQIGVIQYGGGV